NFLTQQGTTFIEDFADLPQASEWLNRQTSSPILQERWRAAGQDLLLSVGIAFAAAFLLELLLLPMRRNLRRRTPTDVARRLAVSMSLLALELLPVILFVVTSVTLLNHREVQKLPHFVVASVVYAMTLNRLLVLLGAILLAPKSPPLR